jgi:hypothetical protein
MTNNKKQPAVRVRCWGACAYQDTPCTVYWNKDPDTGQFRRTAHEGDVVDDYPAGSIEADAGAGYIEVVKDGEK